MPRPLSTTALVALFLLSGPAAAQPASRQPFDDMVATVRALGETAAAAKSRVRAEEQLKKAIALQAAGDDAKAELALLDAYQLVTGAVIEARNGQSLETKRADQYKTSGIDGSHNTVRGRIESVRALLDAYGRIAPEKGGADRAALTEVSGMADLAEARDKAGQTAEAQRLATAAIERASALVIGVRNGDKLTKTLSFDSPGDEYRYELDRNDSYRMLVKLMLSDSGDAALERETAASEKQAAALRLQAEQAANKGDYAKAIKLLDQATQRLGGVLRAGGLPIPG